MALNFNPSDSPDAFGQHLILGVSGTELTDLDKLLLATLRPIGIILFARNFDATAKYRVWREKLEKLIAECRQYTERPELFVSIDHEGGRVHRVPKPLTAFPYARFYAAEAEAVGEAMGRELASIGVSVNFAPCADIHSNPNNPVIGDRAFGTTALAAGTGARAFFEGQRRAKVVGCAKHFPGHGDTAQDSHFELPKILRTEAELVARELAPFSELVQAGIPMVMTAHILFPKIDPLYPATMSEKILSNLLRGGLGFSGVVVSDDLDMKAVASRVTEPDIIGRTIRAGCDMLIVSRNPEDKTNQPLEIARALGKALQQRVVSEDLLHQSFLRIEKLVTNEIVAHKVAELSGDILEEHRRLAEEVAPRGVRGS